MRKNGKQGAARNIGIRYASTDYIGSVDSDDWVELDMYEKMYEKAISTGADVVGVMQRRVDECGKILYAENSYNAKLNIFCKVEEEDYSGLPGGVVCGLFRKQLIVQNNIILLIEIQPLCNGGGKGSRLLLTTARMDMTKEDWERIRKAYLKDMQRSNMKF